MKRLAPFLVVIAVPFLLSANVQSKDADESAAGAKKIEGKWTVDRYEFSGRKSTRPLSDPHDVISGNKWIRPNRRTQYTFKLESKKKPKWIDLSAKRLGDKVLKGIYLLEGDTLMFCYAYDPQLPRPTKFETISGDRCYLYVLKRVKEE